jgi:FkbM family methyltransferase
MLAREPRTFAWIGPLRLIVPRRSGLTGNLYCGLMDFDEMMFMLHFLRSDNLFVDVGANVGVYSLLASGMTGARSRSFEPIPDTYARLREHVALNHLEDKIQCINKGVGEKQGTLTFSSDNNDCLNHVLTDMDKTTHCVKVPVIRLDDLEDLPAECIMKLDIEGYEWYALQGAESLLKSRKIKAIILEFNQLAERYGIVPEQIEQRLTDAGYATYRYNPVERTLQPVAFNTLGNSLWIRDVEDVVPRLRDAGAISIYGRSI